jgi:hypothetical protein
LRGALLRVLARFGFADNFFLADAFLVDACFGAVFFPAALREVFLFGAGGFRLARFFELADFLLDFFLVAMGAV